MWAHSFRIVGYLEVTPLPATRIGLRLGLFIVQEDFCRKLFVLDEDGKEHEMEILRKCFGSRSR